MDLTGVRIKCNNCKRKIKAYDMHWSNGAGDKDEVGQAYDNDTKQAINNKQCGIINICPHCGSARWKRIKAFKH